MSTPVERFLAAQPRELTRAALGDRATDFFESASPVRFGDAWGEVAREAGVPCPAALRALGDAMAQQFIYFRFRGHQYAMLTPEGARRERALLAELAASAPELGPFCQMLPLFAEDGDTLLLDAAGAIWALPHDDAPPRAPEVPSLEALLAEATAPSLNL
ncbi:MAG: hypothetical protein ACOZQL_32630 [Myxococcota bacterium]